MSNQRIRTIPVNVRGIKVALGPLLPEHREIWVAYMQDPEVTLYGGGSFRAHSTEHMSQQFDNFSKDGSDFALYEAAEMTFIGTAGLRRINHHSGTATFGIEIGLKECWGKGYGTEATKLVLDYGFRYLNLYNIDLTTYSFNQRAIRTYQKSGFIETGRRRGAILFNGQRYDEIYMDCLSQEFVPPTPGWYTLPLSGN